MESHSTFLFWMQYKTLSSWATLVAMSSKADVGQGDQIGRIFAEWVIVYLWQFFENYQESHIFWLLFPTAKVS
jgi:hypothetical protein